MWKNMKIQFNANDSSLWQFLKRHGNANIPMISDALCVPTYETNSFRKKKSAHSEVKGQSPCDGLGYYYHFQ